MSSLASEVKIANLALTYLGADRILSLTDDSENARKVNAVFDLTRDAVLRDHVWRFAKYRVELNQLSDAPAFDYSYAYQIPGNVIRILSGETGNEVYVVEGDQVLTDEGTFKCLTIQRVTDPTKWPTDFVTAFAARLAAELAFSISDSRSLSEQMWQLYQGKIAAAKSSSATEGSYEVMDATEWVESRQANANVPLAE